MPLPIIVLSQNENHHQRHGKPDFLISCHRSSVVVSVDRGGPNIDPKIL